MGLPKDDNTSLINHMKQSKFWLLPLAIVALAGVAEAFRDQGRELLKYDRLAIANGEIWRFVSGHFVHLGLQHLLLNVAGLILVWLLVGAQYTTRQWGLVTVISLVVINAGFWLFDPNLIWYVGLSGLLHGFLIAGAIPLSRQTPLEAAIICAAVTAKLVYEQVAGPLPGSEATAGGAVVTDAHLFGAIGGALAAAILWRSVTRQASI